MASTSILKNPSTPRRSVGRVQFALPMDLRPILLDYASGNDVKPFDELITTLRDALPEEQQITLLQNGCRVVGLLDQQMNRLVTSILNIPWVRSSSQLVNAYQQFVVELVAAHNYYTKMVLERVLWSFKAAVVDRTEPWEGLEPEKEIQECFILSHQIIARVLKIVPMAAELLVQVANTGYPYITRSPIEHQLAVYNLLKLCEQQPTLRPKILSLIISRTVSLDAHIPRDELEDALEELENEDDDMEVDGTTSNGVFTMDDLPSSSQSQYSVRSTKTMMSSLGCPLTMGFSLDITMELLFAFFQRFCEQDTSPSDWIHHKELYREMCVIFENQLLLTLGTHHVQFIMFFLCSLRPPSLMEHFLGSLWQRVTQPGETAVARQSAACYIGSLLARACCVNPRFLRSMLLQMSDWCHAYAAAQPDCGVCDVRQHPVFYTVCQSLFYVVAFRHADLVNTNKGLVWTQSLGLGRLVTSRLNPLKPCLPGVAQNFAAVTRTYQLAYCYTVMERNARTTLPCINQNSGQQLTSRLSTFFPFDPYLLPRSTLYIQKLYREYKPLEQPSVASTAVANSAGRTSDGEDQELHSDDEDLVPSSQLQTSHSTTIIKSPVQSGLQHIISPSSLAMDMFSYGSSPGFKHV